MAQCKTENYADAIESCTGALRIDIYTAKALYHRALANMHLSNFPEAFCDCQLAMQANKKD